MRSRLLALIASLALIAAAPDAAAQASVETAGGDDAASEFVPVPELVGGLVAELGLSSVFPLSGGTGALPDIGFAAALGWRHYFDIHGALSLSAKLRGGAVFGDLSDTLGHVGLEVALAARGISDAWFFGELALVAAADVLIWDLGPTAAGQFGLDEQVTGVRVGGGLETNFGMLWYLGPYLLGDLGAQALVEYVDVGGLDGVTVGVRWRFRFEWAVPRDVTTGEAPVEEREKLYEGQGDGDPTAPVE